MTYTVVFLRHSDQIIRGRTSPTRECNGQFAKEQDCFFGSFKAARPSLRTIPAASLPLFTPSAAVGFARTRARTEGCFHRESGAPTPCASPPPGTPPALSHQPVGG